MSLHSEVRVSRCTLQWSTVQWGYYPHSMYTEQYVCSIQCIQSKHVCSFNVYTATSVLNSIYTEQHVCSIQYIQSNMCAQFNIYRATCVFDSMYTEQHVCSFNSMYTVQHVCSIQCIQNNMCAKLNVYRATCVLSLIMAALQELINCWQYRIAMLQLTDLLSAWCPCFLRCDTQMGSISDRGWLYHQFKRFSWYDCSN